MQLILIPIHFNVRVATSFFFGSACYRLVTVGLGLLFGVLCKDVMAQSAETYDDLTQLKKELAKGNRKAEAEVSAIIKSGDRCLGSKTFTVMSKTGIPPSGDKHDYLSLAPYFWPDPSKKDGIPYMRKDGEVNPQTRDNYTDYNEWNKFSDIVDTLAQAYFLTENGGYADKALRLVEVWFVDETTRMNPHLNYAQGVRGQSDGRPFGIIEFGSIAEILQAMRLFEQRDIDGDRIYAGFKKWLHQYAEWLQTSKLGKEEAATKNNHGSMYDLQLVRIFDYLGDQAKATELLHSVCSNRIAEHVKPDGSQPEELSRTKAFSYSLLNLNALTQLAVFGKKYNVPVWECTSQHSGTLKQAYEFLIPYLKKDWPYQQIDGLESSRKRLVGMLLFASREFNEPEWTAIAGKYMPS